MTNHQQALLSISDSFSASMSFDKMLLLCVLATAFVLWLGHGVYYHMVNKHRSPFDSLH